MPYSSRRQVEITNGLGLHLRAANGKSILDLLTLAAQRGSRLKIETRGADAEEAAAALHELIEARFQECEESAHPHERSVS